MNLVEEILQKHLENFTRIILMEECTTKVCCVKLKKLSRTESNNLSRYKEMNKRDLSRKKCMKRKRKYTKSHNWGEKNIYVSSLTLTTPRIRKKSSVHIDSNTTKSVKPDCLIDEFLNDPADTIPPHSKDNTPLKFLRKQPVIIPFSKRKPSRNIGTTLDGNITKCSTVNQGENCKGIPTPQDTKISCYNSAIDGLPIVSTGPPCTSDILRYNIHRLDGHNREPLTGLQINYKHNVLKHRKDRSIQRKFKERWSLKREASSSNGFVFSRKQPYLTNTMYRRSTKIPVIVPRNDLEVECHPFKPITDQELNDGLPDIPMLT